MFDFEKRNAEIDRLCDILDKEEITCHTMLAVVCAKMGIENQSNCKEVLGVAGNKYEIKIKKVGTY